MTVKKTLAVALCAAMALPAAAHAFRAENGVNVARVSAGSFQVEPSRKFGANGMWCAAADYAVRALGTDWTDRLYVQGQGRSNRSVVFGLTPAGATPKGITVVSNSLKNPGSNFSVQRAFQFCLDQRLPTTLFD